MNIFKLIIFFLLLPVMSFSINIEITDSFLHTIQKMPDDTNKVKALNDFAYKTIREKTARSYELSKQALVLAKDLNFVKGQIKAYNILGIGNLLQANNSQAEVYFLKALKISEQANDKLNASKALSNLGALAVRSSNFDKAIEYNLRALELCEENNDIIGVAKCYANIGINHKEAKNYDLALKYLQKGYTISDSINDQQNLGICINAMGSLYMETKKYDTSNYYYKKAINLYLKLPDYYGLAIANGNIASNFTELNTFDSALIYLAISNKYSHKINYQNQILNNYSLMSDIYLKNNNYATSKKFAEHAYQIAIELNDRRHLKSTTYKLAKINSKLYNFAKAYNYLELSNNYSDSILTSEKQELIIELDAKYNSERKQREIELLQKDKLLKEEQLASQAQLIKNQRLQFITILIALFSVLIIAYIYYRNYKNKKLANELLKKQRNTIAKQNKKITDSIVYAQNIQAAILPDPKTINNILPNSFLLFIPRDIVSGDFFWIKELKDKILLAVVDCTGHGVPGAFMSILGTQLLNEIDNFDLTPDLILNELREKLKIAMKQSDYLTSQRDGMDIGLCCIDKKNKVLNYAGANINLIHINNASAKVIKANNQPVAVYLKETSFNNHTITYNNNDQFYLASDGYVDQYGGSKIEKFKSKPFVKLLEQESNHSLPEQKHSIHTNFLTWKGKQEQIDDVTIFGFKCP